MLFKAVLFDFDGTLVDTRQASWDLFARTNRAFNLGIDTQDEFFELFEDNFFDSLARICRDADTGDAVNQHFMNLLRSEYHPVFIPGIVDVIRSLYVDLTLAVISTNALETVRRILFDGGIDDCFSQVFSGDLEPSKSRAIRRFLEQPPGVASGCSPAADAHRRAAAFAPAEVALVTDTVGDLREAVACGIPAIGVAWGMHSERKLLNAGAERVALWPHQLLIWLRGPRALAHPPHEGRRV